MNNDPRGTIVHQGNIMRVDNAFVEDVSCSNNSNGYIVISYSMQGTGGTTSIQTIRLNLNQSTVVLNPFKQRMCPCCVQRGMWVDAVFSARMTRSIPPQANAYLILVQRKAQTPILPSTNTTIGRIASIDAANRFLYTGNPNNINSQTRFVVTDTTSITDRAGRPIRLRSLRPGQLVRITHANFMTASIPPQTTAFQIQLL